MYGITEDEHQTKVAVGEQKQLQGACKATCTHLGKECDNIASNRAREY